MFAKGGFWDVAGGLTQPVFQGGTLRHRELAAKAAYTQAEEQYRSTVLTAFQNVADTLHAIEQDADGLKSAAAATDAAAITLNLTRRQLDSGYTNTLALLAAEQAYQQATLNQVQAQSNRYADTAALFQALGGGWWNRPELPKN
jgi:outer membrane protein TolC